MATNNNWDRASRLGGLRRFAVAITVLNILGHTLFGFEQSIAQPIVGLLTAYLLEILLEAIDAWAKRRPVNFGGGLSNFADFLLSAHITGLAVAMLLYANESLWIIAFATALAVCSKVVLRAPVGSGTRHFLNPSNFGISITLLLFPWVGIAPPYHFTENLGSAGDWVLPAIIVISGSFLNMRFTRRLPLIGAWLCGFFLQAWFRSLLFGTPLTAGLIPMTGVAFILYSFYMVTDPATTPSSYRGQILFGAGTAFAYGMLMLTHAVFGLFFALTIVCVIRGLTLYAQAFAAQRVRAKIPVQTPTMFREA